MKRNILWIVAACLLCLGFTGCQEPDEPRPVAPVLYLYEAQYVTTTTACVGNYNSPSFIGEYYYLLSTNENFRDSLVYKAALNSSETIDAGFAFDRGSKCNGNNCIRGKL